MSDAMETDSGDDIRVVFHYESLCRMAFDGKEYCTLEALTQAEQAGAESQHFRELIADLIINCGPSYKAISTKESLFDSELASQLAILEYPQFASKTYLDTLESRQDLIEFLICEVQMFRILESRKRENDGMEVDTDRKHPPEYILSKTPSTPPSTRQLMMNACQTLGIPFHEDANQCILNMQKKVEEIRQTLPADFDGERVWTEPLTDEETTMALELNEALKEEYTARREMMLKRLDVTLQTLLWSDKAKENYEEMMQIIEEKKRIIVNQGAPSFSLLDVYCAQDDLIAVQKTSISSSVSGTKLAAIVVTDTVDRGGRVNERRKAKDMPAFAARSQTAQKHSSSADAQPVAGQQKPKEQRSNQGGGRGGRGGGRGGHNKRGKNT